MKKSQIPLGMIFGIVLFLLILIPSVLWAKGLFRLSQQATDDFYKLEQLMKEVANSNVHTLESLPFRIDDKTAIVFFNKDAQKLEIDTGAVRRSEVPSPNTVTTAQYIINRPESCVKSCMCVCRNVERSSDGTYLCSNNVCKGEYDFDMVVFTSEYCNNEQVTNCIQATRGGYIIERNTLFTFSKLREIALYVQKIEQNKVAIGDVLDGKNNIVLNSSQPQAP